MKDKIREQSIQLFATKGFKETSIQDIVDALNVTKGTFYYYYTSKELLLMDIQLQYTNNLLQKQREIIEDTTINCKEKIYKIVYMLIHDIDKEGLSALVFFREMRNLNDEHMDFIASKRDQFRLNIQDLLDEGISKKEIRADLPTDIVTFSILGMTNWSYFWFDPNGRVSDKEVSDVFIKVLLEGLEI